MISSNNNAKSDGDRYEMLSRLKAVMESSESRRAREASSRPGGATEPCPSLNLEAMFGLRGKLAVLTNVGGGGSGAIAEIITAAAAHIVIADRDIQSATALVADLTARGRSAFAINTDIESEGEVIALFADVTEAAGGVDILINCAGMAAHKDILDTSIELWDDVQSLNLRANFLCMREGVRQMVKSGRGGRIVNVTTIGGLHPVMNGNGPYGAARLGVKALGESIALDYAPHAILVNTLMVGAVPNRTITHPVIAAELQAGRKLTGPISGSGRVPLGAGNVADVAAAVLYLVSPASRYLTGQSIVLDGGFLLT